MALPTLRWSWLCNGPHTILFWLLQEPDIPKLRSALILAPPWTSVSALLGHSMLLSSYPALSELSSLSYVCSDPCLPFLILLFSLSWFALPRSMPCPCDMLFPVLSTSIWHPCLDESAEIVWLPIRLLCLPFNSQSFCPVSHNVVDLTKNRPFPLTVCLHVTLFSRSKEGPIRPPSRNWAFHSPPGKVEWKRCASWWFHHIVIAAAKKKKHFKRLSDEGLTTFPNSKIGNKCSPVGVGRVPTFIFNIWHPWLEVILLVWHVVDHGRFYHAVFYMSSLFRYYRLIPVLFWNMYLIHTKKMQ